MCVFPMPESRDELVQCWEHKQSEVRAHWSANLVNLQAPDSIRDPVLKNVVGAWKMASK